MTSQCNSRSQKMERAETEYAGKNPVFGQILVFALVFALIFARCSVLCTRLEMRYPGV